MVAAVFSIAGAAVWHFWRVGSGVFARVHQRRLFSNRLGHALGSIGQKRDFDCGICNREGARGPLARRCRAGGRAPALQADFDDIAGLYFGRDAAGL